MPTTIAEKTKRLLHFDYIGSKTDLYSPFVTERYTLNKPTTSKRIRPSDLFASGTGREVWSTKSFVVEGASCIAGLGEDRRKQYAYQVEPYRQSFFGPLSLGQTRDTCDTQTLLEIKDQKVNLSVSIAELGKTTDMVADLARDTFRFFRSLRKGDLKTLLRVMRQPRTPARDDMASKWLKYQYGIIPTVMEVNGLSDFIYRQIKEGFIYGKHTTQNQFKTGVLRSTSWSPGVSPRFGAYYRKNTYRYRVSSQGLRSGSQSGITNPAAFVYELIPYSFVLDWFIPVGDYLAALDALVGIEDLTVIRSDTLYQTDWNYYSPSWSGVISNEQVGFSISRTKRTRRNVPTKDLKPGYPRYEPHVGTTRMISGIALLNNFLKGKI